MQPQEGRINVPKREELQSYAGNNKRTSSVNTGGKFRRQSNSNIRGAVAGGGVGGRNLDRGAGNSNIGRRSSRPDFTSTKQSKIYDLVHQSQS